MPPTASHMGPAMEAAMNLYILVSMSAMYPK